MFLNFNRFSINSTRKQKHIYIYNPVRKALFTIKARWMQEFIRKKTSISWQTQQQISQRNNFSVNWSFEEPVLSLIRNWKLNRTTLNTHSQASTNMMNSNYMLDMYFAKIPVTTSLHIVYHPWPHHPIMYNTCNMLSHLVIFVINIEVIQLHFTYTSREAAHMLNTYKMPRQ